MSRTVFPRIYTNLQSEVYFQFCFQARRPVISKIVDPDMSFYEKWEIITKIFDSWKFKMLVFFLFQKKQSQFFFIFLPYIQRVTFFSITMLDILVFCNILHLELDFWNMSWKRIVSSQTVWQKSSEKHYKWDIEKNGIAYSTARNLKTAHLWNFHFH